MTINPYDGTIEYLEPGYRLIDGDLINEIVKRLNAIQGQVIQTSPYGAVLTVEASGTLFSNEGATSQAVFILPNTSLILPETTAGIRLSFAVENSHGIQIVSRTGQSIYLGDAVSSSGGTATSNLVGAYIQLIAIDSTKWIASSSTSQWTLA